MNPFALVRAVNDLPVLWDGRPVTWGRWHEATQPSHLPEEVCEKCGALGPQRHAFGRRVPLPGPDDPTPSRPLIELMAQRCTSCDADSVYDMVTEEEWLLGPEDYGDTGSTPDGALW